MTETLVASLAGPLWVAALSVFGKIIFDAWTYDRAVRGIAAGLAGEISAYVDLLKPEETPRRYREIAGKARDERVALMRAFPSLPSAHPVFDKVADKLGSLGSEDASSVSRLYNIVTGVRLVIQNMTLAGFLEAPDYYQQNTLNWIAATIETEVPIARELVGRLKDRAARPFWRGIVALIVALIVMAFAIWWSRRLCVGTL